MTDCFAAVNGSRGERKRQEKQEDSGGRNENQDRQIHWDLSVSASRHRRGPTLQNRRSRRASRGGALITVRIVICPPFVRTDTQGYYCGWRPGGGRHLSGL
ncbi:hypothetical protein QQF64_015442 [Cirrhinus molitorella]|uniref:Uncharacterized protein n=1 Tax=Cirrhinus molitorella TaxID=172907 RepID=A0ABR3NVQ1_9TELE